MLAMKNTGKPYAGKLHVRIDEGAGGRFIIPSRSTLLFTLPLRFKNFKLRHYQKPEGLILL